MQDTESSTLIHASGILHPYVVVLALVSFATIRAQARPKNRQVQTQVSAFQRAVCDGVSCARYARRRTRRAQDSAQGLVTKESLEDFSREVRLAAKLDHPNILRLKSADFIDGHLVIALPLGEESLEERLARRLSLRSALDLGEQLLRAVAFAHEQHVIHCDVKPDNLLLFPDGRVAADRLRHLESRPPHNFGVGRRHGRLHGARASDGTAVAAVGRLCNWPGPLADVLGPTCPNGRSNGRLPATPG